MSDKQPSLKTGLYIISLGLLLLAMSAWCEVKAHLHDGRPVQKIAITAGNQSEYKEAPDFYLASSMAVRLFSVGAIFIVVGTLQIQRAHMTERVTRLERELESFRSRQTAAV